MKKVGIAAVVVSIFVATGYFRVSSVKADVPQKFSDGTIIETVGDFTQIKQPDGRICYSAMTYGYYGRSISITCMH